MRIIPDRETSRLEGFSDGVFAFSATLLVVSLEVPSTFPELVADLKGFAAFGVSFAALILIWSIHNAFFRRFSMDDPMTVAINSVLLFVVLFYIYPMKFLVEALVGSLLGLGGTNVALTSVDELALLFILYGGGFTAVFAGVAALYYHAHRRREELELDPQQRHEAILYFRHYMIFVAIGFFSMFLAWTGVGVEAGVPGFVYALLGPLCYAHGVRSERRRQGTVAVVG